MNVSTKCPHPLCVHDYFQDILLTVHDGCGFIFSSKYLLMYFLIIKPNGLIERVRYPILNSRTLSCKTSICSNVMLYHFHQNYLSLLCTCTYTALCDKMFFYFLSTTKPNLFAKHYNKPTLYQSVYFPTSTTIINIIKSSCACARDIFFFFHFFWVIHSVNKFRISDFSTCGNVALCIWYSFIWFVRVLECVCVRLICEIESCAAVYGDKMRAFQKQYNTTLIGMYHGVCTLIYGV